jgi:hypothetical protein
MRAAKGGGAEQRDGEGGREGHDGIDKVNDFDGTAWLLVEADCRDLDRSDQGGLCLT